MIQNQLQFISFKWNSHLNHSTVWKFQTRIKPIAAAIPNFTSNQFNSAQHQFNKKNRRFNWYLNYSTAKNEKNKKLVSKMAVSIQIPSAIERTGRPQSWNLTFKNPVNSFRLQNESFHCCWYFNLFDACQLLLINVQLSK